MHTADLSLKVNGRGCSVNAYCFNAIVACRVCHCREIDTAGTARSSQTSSVYGPRHSSLTRGVDLCKNVDGSKLHSPLVK